jgi:hypothetical protein
MDPRRGEKHARRVCALPGTCGLGESGLGPNKATDYLSRSIVSHVSSWPLYSSMHATAGWGLTHPLFAADSYASNVGEGALQHHLAL